MRRMSSCCRMRTRSPRSRRSACVRCSASQLGHAVQLQIVADVAFGDEDEVVLPATPGALVVAVRPRRHARGGAPWHDCSLERARQRRRRAAGAGRRSRLCASLRGRLGAHRAAARRMAAPGGGHGAAVRRSRSARPAVLRTRRCARRSTGHEPHHAQPGVAHERRQDDARAHAARARHRRSARRAARDRIRRRPHDARDAPRATRCASPTRRASATACGSRAGLRAGIDAARLVPQRRVGPLARPAVLVDAAGAAPCA